MQLFITSVSSEEITSFLVIGDAPLHRRRVRAKRTIPRDDSLRLQAHSVSAAFNDDLHPEIKYISHHSSLYFFSSHFYFVILTHQRNSGAVFQPRTTRLVSAPRPAFPRRPVCLCHQKRAQTSRDLLSTRRWHYRRSLRRIAPSHDYLRTTKWRTCARRVHLIPGRPLPLVPRFVRCTKRPSIQDAQRLSL